MGEYKINDDWLLDAGIARGWNQSLRDNNGCPDFIGGPSPGRRRKATS